MKCTGPSNEKYTKTAEEIEKKGLKWVCNPCVQSRVRNTNNSSRAESSSKREFTIADVMEKLETMDSRYEELLKRFDDQLKVNQELRAEISDLKQQVETLSAKREDRHHPLETIREIDDRESRKNNLMIFGCKESTAEGDTRKVEEIIRLISPDIATIHKKIIRIGTPGQDKTRPIKVTLTSPQEVRNLFFKAKELIKNEQFKHLALGFDKTRREIEEYRALRREMQARIDNGENNLKIKFFRDVPKIIKISVPKN